MSPFQKKQHEKKRKNLFRKWHRRIGFSIAILLLNLSITGILLNHSDDLSLHKKYVQSSWITKLYGIKPPVTAQCAELTDSTDELCQLGENVYLNNQLLIQQAAPLIGLITLNKLHYLATSDTLFIYTENFDLLDEFNQQNELPIKIKYFHQTEHDETDKGEAQIVISNGQQRWRLDATEMNWKIMDNIPKNVLKRNEAAASMKLKRLKKESLKTLQNTYLSTQITQLKLIQDLHSGRIFSLPGKWLTDLTGIALIILVISGFFAWQRRRNKAAIGSEN